jgi:hypothetical protein
MASLASILAPGDVGNKGFPGERVVGARAVYASVKAGSSARQRLASFDLRLSGAARSWAVGPAVRACRLVAVATS